MHASGAQGARCRVAPSHASRQIPPKDPFQTKQGEQVLNNTAWWTISAALIVTGLVGTVLPALPGTIFIFAGIALAAWIDDFTRIGGWVVGVVGFLAVLSFVMDYAAGLMGARRVNASKDAIIGAAIGTVIGIAMGLIGVLFMPLVGAAVGEYIARKDQKNAVKVGVATWVGTMVGLVAKVVIAFVMLGIFAVALWV
jgi:uncharacterized protein